MTETKKEEVRVPISQIEIWKDDGSRRQEVWVRPGIPVAVDSVFVDGDVHALKTPMILQRGQLGRFEVPPKYKKTSMCGVFAGFIDQKGEEVSRCPIGGAMWGEFEPCEVIVKPQSSTYAVFQPESPNPRIAALRFKHFDIKVAVDMTVDPAPQGIDTGTGVVITDIQIGRDSMLFARSNIPIEMVRQPRALVIPTLIQRGTTFTIYVANFGRYPAELTGHIVFEDAPEVKYVVPQNLAQRN